jgi:hypothetical protein
MLVLLMDGLFKCAVEIGLRWHDLRTKFHDDRLRHLSDITVITATI